jgi:hypothetical protein
MGGGLAVVSLLALGILLIWMARPSWLVAA